MGSYYFDTETVSKDKGNKSYTTEDPSKCKIATIQYQRIDSRTGEPIDDLVILKEWRMGEEEMIKQFKEIFITDRRWDFVCIGNNLNYEFRFLKEKLKEHCGYNFDLDDVWDKPHIDIRHSLILANRGSFKGSSLSDFSDKPDQADRVHDWYYSQEYHKILDYIRSETEEFLRVYSTLVKELPGILRLLNKR